jgi:hypothetical protein
VGFEFQCRRRTSGQRPNLAWLLPSHNPKNGKGANSTVTLAGGEPTAVITGCGILKTTKTVA